MIDHSLLVNWRRLRQTFNSNVSPRTVLIRYPILTLYCVVLSCSSMSSPQIRVIINDGVAPLSSIDGCPDDAKYGMCGVDSFVSGMREIIGETDWTWDCHGDWDVPEGDKWQTVDGTPPPRSLFKRTI